MQFPSFAWTFQLRCLPHQVETYTDSIWGGNIIQRRNTSGGIITIDGKVVVKAWSRLQRCVALSSAEAEYYSLMLGAQESLAVRSLLEEMRLQTMVVLKCDSGAAKAAVERSGLLHMKHLQLKARFLKKLQKEGMIQVLKVPGISNRLMD